MRSVVVTLLFGLSACAHSQAPPLESPSLEASNSGAEASAPEAPVSSGEITRAALLPVLDGGLGRFLQGVETEPELEDGRFVGFRIARLYPDDPRFRAIDLGPGDTILKVNGQSVERPEQALSVWNGLRVASELWIEYSREGELRELRFAIVD
ncbi:MAG: hypothetical protein GXP55_14290 [Deltaproteobacteria bacterium]|nr:hypothetical protein [Deltaproteobacteria bacterium]